MKKLFVFTILFFGFGINLYSQVTVSLDDYENIDNKQYLLIKTDNHNYLEDVLFVNSINTTKELQIRSINLKNSKNLIVLTNQEDNAKLIYVKLPLNSNAKITEITTNDIENTIKVSYIYSYVAEPMSAGTGGYYPCIIQKKETTKFVSLKPNIKAPAYAKTALKDNTFLRQFVNKIAFYSNFYRN